MTTNNVVNCSFTANVNPIKTECEMTPNSRMATAINCAIPSDVVVSYSGVTSSSDIDLISFSRSIGVKRG